MLVSSRAKIAILSSYSIDQQKRFSKNVFIPYIQFFSQIDINYNFSTFSIE
jgi:hypothetical protein